MIISKTSLLLFLLLFAGFQMYGQEKSRTVISFNIDWKFYLGDSAKTWDASFEEKNWKKLDLPHDWSIEGKFSLNNPAGPGGGALPGGIGWYWKTFFIPEVSAGKNISIDFDGVYRNSEVWINGHVLGRRPNGYISFRYDLTPFLFYGNKKNTIVVRVDNSQQPNSRWYSGSGIYRNVWLVTTNKIFIPHWGTYITTPIVTADSANLDILVKIENSLEIQKTVFVKSILLDSNKQKVSEAISKTTVDAHAIGEVHQKAILFHPKLWSVDNPYLYTVSTQILDENLTVDVNETEIGIRHFEFDAANGFILNGKRIKINGVCDHHDLGCLGSAIHARALQRQLEILKAMGCNGIRTSHNPPAPELLDLCDRMGFIVMDEAFDMWKKGKNRFDYHNDWDDWHKKDLEDQVLRDRNHASVFIWSIGNEIPEQWTNDSTRFMIPCELRQIIRSLDTIRPITAALNQHDLSINAIYQSGALDLVGYNYDHPDYPDFMKKNPGRKFIGSETVSALETRGFYDMPSDSIRRWPTEWDKPMTEGNPELACSSYDNVSAPWGSTHEETWKVIKKYDFLSGQYIWTGFDYLGEPTPYPWPARSSYFGIIDLAGFPKDIYYMYQSEWTDKAVLHLFPHWNWKPGQIIDVWAYYNQADEVELFLNGKTLGIRKKTGDDLHVAWRVAYEPGTIKAISRKNGKIVLTTEINTAGKATHIELKADRNIIQSDGKDLSFITARVTDDEGNLVPDADNLIQFSVSGNGNLVATDNGSQTSLESFQASAHQAFHGLCLAVIQSTHDNGKIVLTATGKNLEPVSIHITSY